MRWYRAWRRGGRGALRAAGRAGRKPRVTPEQLAEIDAALRQGPRAQGFRTSLLYARNFLGTVIAIVDPTLWVAPLGDRCS